MQDQDPPKLSARGNLFGQRERENTGTGGDCDVLLAIELIGHRGGFPELAGLEGPKRLSVRRVRRYEGAAVIAIEQQAGGGGERAAPGGRQPDFRNLPFHRSGLWIERPQDALRL